MLIPVFWARDSIPVLIKNAEAGCWLAKALHTHILFSASPMAGGLR
jgi:hypothetical protein